MTNQLEIPPNKEKDSSFSLDKFFLMLTASGFIFGTAFTCLLSSFPFPLLPSIFFGSAVSSLVYRFMGGIKPEDSIEIGTVKLSGTLGSLIASIFVLNYMFEQQIPPWSVFVPNASNLIVLNSNGLPTKLDVETKSIKTFKTLAVGPASPDLINTFRRNCWEGSGICKDEPKKAIFIGDNSISAGKAKLCMNNSSLLGLPLILTDGKTKATRVEIHSIESCNDESQELITVKITSKDMKDLEETNGGKGEVSIAPLKNLVGPDKS